MYSIGTQVTDVLPQEASPCNNGQKRACHTSRRARQRDGGGASAGTRTSCLATSMALSRHSSRHELAYARMARSKAGNCDVRFSSIRPSSVYFCALREAALRARVSSHMWPVAARDALPSID